MLSYGMQKSLELFLRLSSIINIRQVPKMPSNIKYILLTSTPTQLHKTFKIEIFQNSLNLGGTIIMSATGEPGGTVLSL